MLTPDSFLQSRYRIIRQLGAGGMGTVYEAFDERLNRTVALKETSAQTDEMLRAFEREAHLLANLRHPSLPTVSDYFTENDKKYLVMEFIRGDDLSQVLRAQGRPFAASQVARWADELLDALVYLHGHEPPIIHRDIKPANLKLSATGKVMLLDFGLAKGLAGQMPSDTQSRSILGYSPHYASLEQMQGERTTPQSDLYSLAATLYNLLTNLKPPDAMKRVGAFVANAADPLEPIGKVNPNIPVSVARAIMRGLALNPAQRPASAAEMRASLHDVENLSSSPRLDHAPEARPAASTKVALPKRGSRRNEMTAIALLAVGAMLALCLVFFHPDAPSLNASGQAHTDNLIGPIGAYVSDVLLQTFGLAAYLLPLLLFAASVRRFQKKPLRAPLGRVIGLALLLLSTAGLLSLIISSLFFDGHVRAGGFVGALLATRLAGAAGGIGALILLTGSAVVAVLLATNFSFAHAYARAVEAFGSPQDFARSQREAARRDAEKQAERASRELARQEEKRLRNKIGAVRVEEFMREPLPLDALAGTDIHRTAGAAAEIEEMIRDVSAVRTEPVENAFPAKRAREKASKEAHKLERMAASMSDYKMPPIDFLNASPPHHEQADEELRSTATRIAEKLKSFNISGKVEYICPGPVFTTYEFKPDLDVKLSRMTGLVDDLCLALRAESIRIDRVPGKAHVGIEVPNARRDNIMLREVVESRQYQETTSKLALALGKTIDGLNYVADLARMPHLLIAGATGTGKSVCLNSLVVSILYKARPDEVKFIMIDPKRLELGLYADIPHLATPIITDPKRAANALKWAVGEMERRYKQLAQWGVRNIDGYNAEVLRRNLVEDFDDEGDPHQLLPYIVIIIDEISELIRCPGEDIEEAITRLTESGRSAGLHVIVAAQRPNADNVAKAIKETFPCRVAFRVTSKADSREVLNAEGAEHLLAWGDMLFLPPGTSRLVRIHGAFVDEAEIGRIVAHIKAQGAPVYDETITQSEEEVADARFVAGERDELFQEALRICVEMKRASTSVLQRRLRIGYGRAAVILDAMEREGLIGQADGARPRPVLGKAFEIVNHWDEEERDAN